MCAKTERGDRGNVKHFVYGTAEKSIEHIVNNSGLNYMYSPTTWARTTTTNDSRGVDVVAVSLGGVRVEGHAVVVEGQRGGEPVLVLVGHTSRLRKRHFFRLVCTQRLPLRVQLALVVQSALHVRLQKNNHDLSHANGYFMNSIAKSY